MAQKVSPFVPCTCPGQTHSSSGEFIHLAGCPVLAARNADMVQREAPQLKQHGPYDRELSIFTALMRMKMEKYAHRGRWNTADLKGVLQKLKAEVTELEAAIDQGDVVNVLLEAPDVANYAMIAAFVAMESRK